MFRARGSPGPLLVTWFRTRTDVKHAPDGDAAGGVVSAGRDQGRRGRQLRAVFREPTGVELCLYQGPEGDREIARVDLTERTDLVWHAYVPRLEPGQPYAYRVHGRYDPPSGHRFNPAKCSSTPTPAPSTDGGLHDFVRRLIALRREH
jgi:hypothetical protein